MTDTAKHGLALPADGDTDWGTPYRAAMQKIDDRLPWSYAGNPNGNVAGLYVGQLVFDSTNNILYSCDTAGNAETAVWIAAGNPGALLQGRATIYQAGSGLVSNHVGFSYSVDAIGDTVYRSAAFANTGDPTSFFQIRMPKSYNGGVIRFVPIWFATAGSGQVVWELATTSLRHGSAMNASYETGTAVNQTLSALNQLQTPSESGDVAVNEDWEAMDTMLLRLRRNTSAVNDDFSGTAKLLGLNVFYNTDKANDN